MDEVPSSSGPFGMFSSIQSVIITGYIDTPSSAEGLISYSTDLYYHFSCRYPLEYLINNTQIVAWVLRRSTSTAYFTNCSVTTRGLTWLIFFMQVIGVSGHQWQQWNFHWHSQHECLQCECRFVLNPLLWMQNVSHF